MDIERVLHTNFQAYKPFHWCIHLAYDDKANLLSQKKS